MLENEQVVAHRGGDPRRPARRSGASMQDCVARGCHARASCPAACKVAPPRRRRCRSACSSRGASDDPLRGMDWVNLYALAVNEENAAGGRVVTAPTNGAAGIIPAVLHYYARFVPGADRRRHRPLPAHRRRDRHALQGERLDLRRRGRLPGRGRRRPARWRPAAWPRSLGGTPEQVENAAEIGMEHNLGLTCDPIGGLVQIPCIERNAMGAVKAINAARMALRGDGTPPSSPRQGHQDDARDRRAT